MRFVLIAIVATLLSGAVCAQTSVEWTTNYYNVSGTTVAEIHQSLRQNRPWRDNSGHHALTSWRVTWNFYVGNSDRGCRMTSFSTRSTINITLPRWIAPTNAPQEVLQAWQRYITALGQHEAGHAQFALAAAAEMHKRVKEIPEGGDCNGLRANINGLGQGILADYKNREKEYDRRTNHGITQGATLRSRSRQPQ